MLLQTYPIRSRGNLQKLFLEFERGVSLVMEEKHSSYINEADMELSMQMNCLFFANACRKFLELYFTDPFIIPSIVIIIKNVVI